MGWLNKILRRGGDDHDAWLEKNPGKRSMGAPPPATSPEEQQRMRDQMEGELDTQRTKRDEA